MVVTWIVALGLIVFAQVATRNMKQVPDGAQNFLEWLVESLYGFLEGILGPHLVAADVLVLRHDLHLHPRRELGRARFPASARSAGDTRRPRAFGSSEPFFRGANADVNLTLAMALVFFACWIVWGLREVGPVGVLQGAVRAEGREHRRC